MEHMKASVETKVLPCWLRGEEALKTVGDPPTVAS